MPDCNDCHEEFDTWVELAQHIVSQRSSHTRSSVVWALTFLAKKDNVQEHKPRMPMSEETRKIIKECVRETSGEMREVRTVCPDCHKVDTTKLDVEYVQDREAWRNSNGTYIAMCEKCKVLYHSNKIKRDNVETVSDKL
jgi:hypothetical protein